MIKKSVKIVLILCAVLIVLSGILVGFRVILHKPTEEKEIYTVKVETYENIIEISGTVSAAQQQTLQALSAGTVVAVNVKAGDSVKKGDVILQLDNTTELYNLAKHDAKEHIAEPVPLQIRNAPTKLMKELDYGKGYQFAHDYEEKMTAMQCLPDSLVNREYFKPTEQGLEAKYKAKLQQIKDWKKSHSID